MHRHRSQVLDRLLDPVSAPRADCCGVLGPIRGINDKEAGAGASGRESAVSSASASTDELADLEKGNVGAGVDSGKGGVAVFAAGPRSLIREAGSTEAAAHLGKGREVDGVSFSAEAFTI